MGKVVKTITISSEVWDFLQKQGNASGFIDSMIKRELQKSPIDDALDSITAEADDFANNFNIFRKIKDTLTRDEYNAIYKMQALDYEAGNAGSLLSHVQTNFRNKAAWGRTLSYWRRQAKDLYNKEI